MATPRENAEFVREVRRKLFDKDDDEAIPGLDKGFLITKHVAWQLRGEGWGLVKAKPGSENNVDGYTSDIIAKPNGFHVDILIASGEINGASWQPNYNQEHWVPIKSRVVPALDMGDIFSDTPPPAIDPNQNGELVQRVAALEQVVKKLLTSRKVVLKAYNGRFVCADGDKMHLLIANRESIGAWEIFEVFTVDQ